MFRPLQKQVPKGSYIEVLVSTWSKDSHALYDYEAVDNKFYNESFYVSKSTRIYRHITTMRTNILEEGDNRELPVQNIYIGTLLADKEGRFKFQSAAISGVQPNQIIREQHPDLFNNSYVVIRDFEHPFGYALKPGNVIRIGRVEYAVLQIKDKNTVSTYKQTTHMQLNKGTLEVQPGKNSQGSCRICLCQESPPEDPLIAPCVCKGSCELIHVGCLRNWINSKVKKDINGIAVSYNFSKFQCEICKTLFPKIVKLEDATEIDMITIQKPEKPYIILESLNDKSEATKEERNLHLICPQEGQPLKLGRGHQCEIRITDISVSRTHAEMRFDDGKFYIRDLKSKFGTLIKFKQEFQVKNKLRIQYGRTVFQFNMHKDKCEVDTEG